VRAVAVVGSASVAMVLSAYAGLGRVALANYDVEPMARRLADLQSAGRPIAHLGKYHGQFQFAGRLRQPLAVFESPDALRRWTADHPDGGVVVYSRVPPPLPGGEPEFVQRYRGGHLMLWRAEDYARIGAPRGELSRR
jgi:hypothetical protein